MSGLRDRHWPFVNGGYNSIYTLVNHFLVKTWDVGGEGLVDALSDGSGKSD